MLAAALVPDTVLLLPGAAGRGPDEAALRALRAAAGAVVADAVAGAERVVVVAPGARDRALTGDVPLGAGAAGVPDHLLREPVPTVRLRPAPGAPDAAVGGAETGTVVGLRLALAAGTRAERLHAVEVAPGPAGALRALGAALGADPSTALVVVGSGSARHGDDAPLPGDPRADDLDDALLRALADGAGPARRALAALDPATAAALAVTGWAPWQVLVGALDARAATARDEGPAPEVRLATVWRGAAHAAVLWRAAS
ncbi:hypothetical protein [Cellulomonas sp. HD19AZ1]|uniref:hypothetical protein n=1 Tax=Cellulomonas sp. HD19AZ1 TaxID=2559593 RepID=UPI0010714A0A|nr:hypothetical protein [Cellulomonas sp. HD19AZ1]TFH72621.1 hypothetical protein E4A51_04040 [Cellulomonas sp. HD19AZ1]